MNKKVVLSIEGIVAGYGDSTILRGVNIEVHEKEIVAVLGPNGAGKSTLLKVICGLLPSRQGHVCLHGENITNLSAEKIVRLGLVYIPQVENVFPSLTVRENLELMFPTSTSRVIVNEQIDKTINIFPRLSEHLSRNAVLLSGGERQMLAMARALIANPTMVMIDEPSAGLAPLIVDQVIGFISTIRENDVSVLLVEQNVRKALSLADRAYILEGGQNRLEGKGDDLLHDPQISKLYLGGSISQK